MWWWLWSAVAKWVTTDGSDIGTAADTPPPIDFYRSAECQISGLMLKRMKISLFLIKLQSLTTSGSVWKRAIITRARDRVFFRTPCLSHAVSSMPCLGTRVWFFVACIYFFESTLSHVKPRSLTSVVPSLLLSVAFCTRADLPLVFSIFRQLGAMISVCLPINISFEKFKS